MDCFTHPKTEVKNLEWYHTAQVILQLTFSNLVYVFEAYTCGHDLDLSENYAALNCGILQLEMLLEIIQLPTFTLQERKMTVLKWQMACPGWPSRSVTESGLASDLPTLTGSLGLPLSPLSQRQNHLLILTKRLITLCVVLF